MPQKVRPSNVDKKVEVMFRARNVFTDVAIKVRSNGEELASFKRTHGTRRNGKDRYSESIFR